jgi:hypothetical protein
MSIKKVGNLHQESGQSSSRKWAISIKKVGNLHQESGQSPSKKWAISINQAIFPSTFPKKSEIFTKKPIALIIA